MFYLKKSCGAACACVLPAGAEHEGKFGVEILGSDQVDHRGR
jgi:hypothetical protein